jgi:hypothetical protein
VQDLDGQVVALLSHQVPRFPLQDHACPVMRVDDVVTDLEGALRGLDLEIGDSRLVYNLLC